MEKIENCVKMQSLCSDTMRMLCSSIYPGMNLLEIREMAEDFMIANGADSFWYYNVGAFVFSGDETTISISGRNYKTSSKLIEQNDIITVDLSPQKNNCWGDFARTIIIEAGKVVEKPECVKNDEWKKGILFEDKLHKQLLKIAKPDMIFGDLFYKMNNFIKLHGFINLDFAGNLGHSIVNYKDDRIYIEKGNSVRLSDVEMFSFEPHIGLFGSNYGFKKEDIYYFENETLRVL